MIESKRLKDGWILFVDLPPSNNARMMSVPMGRHSRMILTKDAREYIARWSLAFRHWVACTKFKAIDDYRWVDLWFILPRTNADCHNFTKVLFDCMEPWVVVNDKFILPRFQGVYHNSKDPIVIIKLTEVK